VNPLGAGARTKVFGLPVPVEIRSNQRIAFCPSSAIIDDRDDGRESMRRRLVEPDCVRLQLRIRGARIAAGFVAADDSRRLDRLRLRGIHQKDGTIWSQGGIQDRQAFAAGSLSRDSDVFRKRPWRAGREISTARSS